MRAVSVCIIACDEEDFIAEAVASAVWAAEVVVLDSGSGDRTVDVARAAGATVAVEAWRGYGAQKNRAAGLATNDWVFSLDADERVGPGLAREVFVLGEDPGSAAFKVRRRNRFAGRVIHHWPWSWDTTVRLYDRRRARFSERAVHESLEVDGAVGRLDGVLEHSSYRGWEDYRLKQERYARLGAEEARAAGRRVWAWDLALRPAATFLRHFVARGYVLGGVLGLRLSLAAARGTAMKYRYLGLLRTR